MDVTYTVMFDRGTFYGEFADWKFVTPAEAWQAAIDALAAHDAVTDAEWAEVEFAARCGGGTFRSVATAAGVVAVGETAWMRQVRYI